MIMLMSYTGGINITLIDSQGLQFFPSQMVCSEFLLILLQVFVFL